MELSVKDKFLKDIETLLVRPRRLATGSPCSPLVRVRHGFIYGIPNFMVEIIASSV
jgi:hypothetical protein